MARWLVIGSADVCVIFKTGKHLNNDNEHVRAAEASMSDLHTGNILVRSCYSPPPKPTEQCLLRHSFISLLSQHSPCPTIQHQDCILSKTHPACFYSFTFRFVQPTIALPPKVFSGLPEMMPSQRFPLCPLNPHLHLPTPAALN